MTCPAPLPGFSPRQIISPSALRQHADCPAQWGRASLEGRREASVAYEDLPAPPAKAPKGASAVAKRTAAKALKAYNRTMRPCLGTAAHAIGEALYLQKVPGAWQAPRIWIDLAVAWETRPGQIFLTGRQHLPDPASLAEVWCEDLVTVQPVPGWEGPWPLLGGTPDLVTFDGQRYHLYDYKTTLSFGYAKTAAELHDHDEQAAIYSLAVMQAHGLESLDCTWVYMRTEGAPASIAVHFTMARAHAEARCLELARQAVIMAALTAEYVAAPRGFLGDGKRLAIIDGLPTEESACPNYGGCVYHIERGGPCKPAKRAHVGLGTALRSDAHKRATKTGRKHAAREARDIMAEETFAQKRARLAAEKAAGGASEPAPAKEIETTGEDAPAVKAETGTTETITKGGVAGASGKPAKATPAKPDADTVTCSCGEYSLALPPRSPLYKAIVKACKAQQAADAAIMGE